MYRYLNVCDSCDMKTNNSSLCIFENANSAAKSPLDLPRVKIGVSYTDFKQHIN